MPFKLHPTDPDKMVWVPPQYNLMWPKREWVGLTEEEVNDLYNAGMGVHATIEATEEKLKEKNHAN